MEEAKALLQNQKQKIYEADKRLELIPNLHEIKLKSSNFPIKPIAFIEDNTKSKGKIDVYHPISEAAKFSNFLLLNYHTPSLHKILIMYLIHL